MDELSVIPVKLSEDYRHAIETMRCMGFHQNQKTLLKILRKYHGDINTVIECDFYRNVEQQRKEKLKVKKAFMIVNYKRSELLLDILLPIFKK
jgi:hypothetical protein